MAAKIILNNTLLLLFLDLSNLPIFNALPVHFFFSAMVMGNGEPNGCIVTTLKFLTERVDLALLLCKGRGKVSYTDN